MNLPEFSLRNKQFILAVFCMTFGFGLYTLLKMPKTEDPFFSVPHFGVVVIYPGTNPANMEKLVVDHIEKALNELEDIDRITTKISDGLSVTNIHFNQGVDENKKYDEVIRQVNLARSEMPNNIPAVKIIQASTSDVNILQYALVGADCQYDQLRNLAEDLEKEISKASGIKKTEIAASPQKEVHISVDMNRLAARHIPLNQVYQAVQSDNANIPGGFTDIGNNRFSIVSSGSYAALDEIKKTIINRSAGNVTFLSDVADVDWKTEDLSHTAKYNGSRCAYISVSQQAGTNIFDVVKGVEKKADDFSKTLPAGIKLVKLFDQSVSVNERLAHLYRDFIIAIVLVLITLLPLGSRASIIVLFAVPASLMIGVISLNAAGQSLNQLSIVGFIIALGLLVDDSIIVVENIVRFIRSKMKKEAACVAGTMQLTFAILGVTAVIILSFFPLVTMQGAIGEFFRSFPLAVIFTVIGSLLVSMTLTPLLTNLILTEEMPEQGNFFTRLANKLNEGWFQRQMRICLRHPKTTVAAALIVSLTGIALIPVVKITGFPSAEKPQFFINVKLPAGSTFSASDSISGIIRSDLLKSPEVKSVAENIGKGNPRIYYNLLQSQQKAQFAQLFVTLREYDSKRTPRFYEMLRKRYSTFPGVVVEIKEFVQGTPVDSPIEFFVMVKDLDTLDKVAGQVTACLKSVPGIIDIDNPLDEKKSDIRVQVNKEKAAMLGVPEVELDKTVRMSFTGLQMGDLIDEIGGSYKIIVTQKDDNIVGKLEKIDQTYVNSISGNPIPLRNLIDVTFKRSTSALEHRDRQRCITISANAAHGRTAEELTGKAIDKIAALNLPAGFSVDYGGVKLDQQKNFQSLTGALFVAIFAILAILILEFKTIRGVFIVASAIPLGIFGAVILLLLLGYSFSISAFVGVITLIGLEVKNTIIIVDFTNQMRQQGHTIDEAIQLANTERFMPILLTTLTATCGLIPLIIENSLFYSPLAAVIVGGLISSFFLTRFLTPVLYKLLMK